MPSSLQVGIFFKLLFMVITRKQNVTAPKHTSETEKEINNDHVLILFNDDVNTFQHVTSSLMEICKHNNEQAFQCALIAHMKGNCEIKTGEFDFLNELKRALISKGLTAVVDKISKD